MGERLAMFVFLSKKRNGLKSLEKKKINYKSVTSAVVNLRKQTIAVSLPKFKMTWGIKLKKILMAMGMTRAFSRANFSVIARCGDLRVKDVLHRAVIEVDEKATEAAAVTVVITNTATALHPEFVADHPFLFLIRDTLVETLRIDESSSVC